MANGGRGGAQWFQIINVDGKRTERGLGGYPLVTLDQARQVAFENRRAVRRGENPWADNDAAKVVPVAAGRAKQRISAVMQWAIAKDYRQDNPVAAVASVLPKNGRPPSTMLRCPTPTCQALSPRCAMATPNYGTVLAFYFLVLTAARSGEVRQATWAEIDLEAGVWNVLAEHMKANAEHIVPLSVQALAVLENAADEYGNDGLIFPSPRGKTERLASCCATTT